MIGNQSTSITDNYLITEGDYTNKNYLENNTFFKLDRAIGPITNLTIIRGNNITYSLSIPKLKIKDAVVAVGSMDLKKSLIQYPQTSLPGQLGNAVVFGHSVLPQFFNPSNYLTIFSTLYKLKQGDDIIIDYGNVQYKYIVDEMFEVKPTDLSVLEQRFDQKNLTLITCSPPGTYLRRLIIKSSLAIN